jgi:hypothetical protein
MAFGPFSASYAIQIVQVAIILHVVAHAVDEEIRGGAVAANRKLIAIIFALRRRDAGDVADQVADARHQLVLDLILRDDGDRLRHVAQRLSASGSPWMSRRSDSPPGPQPRPAQAPEPVATRSHSDPAVPWRSRCLRSASSKLSLAIVSVYVPDSTGERELAFWLVTVVRGIAFGVAITLHGRAWECCICRIDDSASHRYLRISVP